MIPLVLTSAAFLSCLLIASPVEAKGQDRSATDQPVREGFTLGASYGRGSIAIDCDLCSEATLTEALSVAGHVGYMVTPRIAILGEHWTVRYNARGGAIFDDTVKHLVAQHMSTVAAQVYVTDSIWLKAGLGVGWHITDGDYAKSFPQSSGPQLANAKGSSTNPSPQDVSNKGAASFVAVGWEVAHNQVMAVDVQFRVGTTRRQDDKFQVYNTGVNVGFTWF